MRCTLALVLLTACRAIPTSTGETSTSSASRTYTPDAASATVQQGRAGGFVVFAGEDESYVIPVDPAVDAQRYPGLFVGGTDASAKVLFEIGLAESWEGPAIHLPYCVDAFEDDSCGTLDRTEVVAAVATLEPDGVRVEPRGPAGQACDCVHVDGLTDEGRERYVEALKERLDIDDEELEYSDHDIETYVSVCYEGDDDLPLTAITSGVVHRHDIRSNLECTGLNNYALESTMEDLRAGGSWQPFEVDESFVCHEDIDVAMAMEPDLSQGCRFGEDDCCPQAGEGVAHRIVSGMLIEFGGDVSPVGEACACVRRRPISAQTCGSAFDPCGTAEAFVTLESAQAWWVASDGSAGLGVSEAGDFVLYAPGEREPVRIEGLGYAAEDVLGVEFLPTVPAAEPAIAQVLVVDVPTSDETPTKSWGNLCFERFKQGKLDAAEAACVEGLLDNVGTGDDSARGALLYSLGRVEEARGHGHRARLLYGRSLALRPGNAAVKARLSGL